MIGPLPEERFALLVNLGKKITDFQTKTSEVSTRAVEEDTLAETHGINVQFDEQSDEDDDENVYGEINDEDEDDEGDEAQDSSAIQAQNVKNYNTLINCFLSILCNYSLKYIIFYSIIPVD